MIAYAEGTDRPDGYQTTFGYGPKLDLNAGHPDRVQGSGPLKSAAAGRYQHMPETWIRSNGGKNVAMTPANQDASALRLIRQRGVDPEKDPLTPENVAKLAPEWASLPTLAGKSYYGQPVKGFGELQSRWSKTGQSAPAPAGSAPRSSAPKPTLAGVESLQGANPMSAILAAGLGGSVPLAQGRKFAGELDALTKGFTKLITGEDEPAPQQAQFSQQPAATKPLPTAPPPGSDTIGLAAVRALMGGSEPSAAPPAPAPEIAADTSFTQPPAAPTPVSRPAGKGAAFERPESITYDDQQPGMDAWFTSKGVPALLAGRVKDIGRQGGNGKGYGNFVVVEGQDPRSGKPVDALYAHLADDGVNVKIGDQLQEGQILGRQGGTGRVVSADGTIASIDFLAPAPRGSGSMVPFPEFDSLRRHLAQRLRPG